MINGIHGNRPDALEVQGLGDTNVRVLDLGGNTILFGVGMSRRRAFDPEDLFQGSTFTEASNISSIERIDAEDISDWLKGAEQIDGSENLASMIGPLEWGSIPDRPARGNLSPLDVMMTSLRSMRTRANRLICISDTDITPLDMINEINLPSKIDVSPGLGGIKLSVPKIAGGILIPITVEGAHSIAAKIDLAIENAGQKQSFWSGR
jgi:hypothetical protein